MTAHISRGGAAQLFRSRAAFRGEIEYFESELIGDGSLKKMVRIALADPDDELWRYSIRHGSLVIVGDDIRDFIAIVEE